MSYDTEHLAIYLFWFIRMTNVDRPQWVTNGVRDLKSMKASDASEEAQTHWKRARGQFC